MTLRSLGVRNTMLGFSAGFTGDFLEQELREKAGVPGAGMIVLSTVLMSVGLPVDGIALVAGIDRILDMGRTLTNVTGDAMTACIMEQTINKCKK